MSRLARPSLPAWAAFVASALLAIGLVGTLIATIHAWGFDFGGYWSAAHIPFREGWSHIYDRSAQQDAYRSLGLARAGDGYVNFYIAPPPLLWLVLPLVSLPFRAAAIIWSLIQLAALIAAWWLAAPRGAQTRAITLLAMLGAFPIAYCIFWGQAIGFIVLGLSAAYFFIRRNQPIAAGLALCVLALKPQDMFLVPLALLAAGYWRVFLVWAGGTAMLAAASAALVGLGGLEKLLELQRSFVGSGFSEGPIMTTAGLPGALLGAALIAAAVIAWAWYTRDLATAMWAGVAGSLASTPYIHEVDLALLLVAGWVVLRERAATTWAPWLVAATWIAAQLFLLAYPVLAFGGLAIWIAGYVLLGRSARRELRAAEGPMLAASSA